MTDLQAEFNEDQNLDLSEYPEVLFRLTLEIKTVEKQIANLEKMIITYEDQIYQEIQGEVYIEVTGVHKKSQKTRRRYSSEQARERELRIRCSKNEVYLKWLENRENLTDRKDRLRARYDKLRRQMRLLEDERINSGVRKFSQIRHCS